MTTVRLLVYVFLAAVLVFLMAPLLTIIPLSFNAEPYFSYPIERYSTHWYEDFFTSPAWRLAIYNSFVIAIPTTFFSLVIGTMAAVGFVTSRLPFKAALLAFLVSPMMIPHVVIALGLFLFFARLDMARTYSALIVAHTVLATPMVLLVMIATLSTFKVSLYRAAISLGASPFRAIRTVLIPLLVPGLIAGAAFAFIVSFDEIIVTMFLAGPEQRTVPRMIWSGMRESISPLIMVAATVLTFFSVLILVGTALIRRRQEPHGR